MTPSPGRVPLLSPDELADDVRASLGGWQDLTFTRVLLRHPRLYRTFVAHMGALVTRTSLPVRDREIVVLRTLELCGDTYEKAHHLAMARAAGLTEEETDAILAGGGDALTDDDRVLLRATEELHHDRTIADETWSALGARYSLAQQMEVVHLAGCFQAVALLTRTFGMELEADLERFHDRRG